MQEIIIDNEIKELLPPLDKTTYKSLEENIIANGCMFPLVTWNNILIDGHNRYAICTEHNILYKTIEKEFTSREDVIIWIIGNQVARRNLTPMQLTYFRGLHYNTAKLKRGAQPGNTYASKQMSDNQTFVSEPATAEKLSTQYKVSRDTIYTDAKATKAIDAIGKASPDAKSKILSGDIAIDKKELQKLAAATDDEIAKLADEIANGTYKKEKAVTQEETDNNPVLNRDGIGGAVTGSGSTNDMSEQTIRMYISSETGRAYNDFIQIITNSSVTRIKKALRELIDNLEYLYTHV